MDDVVAVVTDLFFQMRISAAARRASRSVRFTTSDDAVRAVRGFALALIDLDAHVDVLAATRTLKDVYPGLVVAFGPHVDTDLRRAARAAGATRVMAKSKFVIELPALLQTPEGDAGAPQEQSPPVAEPAAE
ncbi:MAG: hypothetical protein NVSMB22_20850 [Chloroflexota bacterium]